MKRYLLCALLALIALGSVPVLAQTPPPPPATAPLDISLVPVTESPSSPPGTVVVVHRRYHHVWYRHWVIVHRRHFRHVHFHHGHGHRR